MEREELIARATRIAEIRSELQRLVGLQATLQEELKTLEESLDGVARASAATRTRRKNGESIEDRVYSFLLGHLQTDHDWDASQIAQELGIKAPTTRAALSKLRAARKIIDTARGRVRAKAEQENLREEDGFGVRAA